MKFDPSNIALKAPRAAAQQRVTCWARESVEQSLEGVESTSVAEVTNATMAAKPTEATPLRRPDGGVNFATALKKEYAAVLARPGGRPSRLACLDGARFLAFLWVVSYHSTMGFKSWTAEATGAHRCV